MKSRATIKNHVRFKGEFKKEFVDEFPGRDVAEFIAEQLRQRNYVVNSVEYEDIWFTVKVVSGSIEYPLMVSHSAMEEDYWEVSCPRTIGAFARFRGQSEDTELQSLAHALDEILRNEKTITDIQWYDDYSELLDDYEKQPAAKFTIAVYNYLEKLILPCCLTGLILGLIGGIRSGKDSLLLRIGTIMFLLPIIAWFGLLVINLFLALFYSIKDSRGEKTGKKWLRRFIYFAVIAMIVIPFALGFTRSSWVDTFLSSIHKYLFGFLATVLYGGFLFAIFCGFLSEIHKQRERGMWIIHGVCFTLFFLGATSFFSGFLAISGMLSWIPKSIEFPLAEMKSIDVDGKGRLFTASGFYNRIQVYNTNGDFVKGWFISGIIGSNIKMRINDANEVEIASLGGRKFVVFDENGKLLRFTKYDEHDIVFWDSFEHAGRHAFDPSTGFGYDVKGWVFPEIIQSGPNGKKEIGKNALYLFPFQGPAQGWVTAITGMVLLSRLDKKKKK